MSTSALPALLLDASVLVALHIEEPRSQVVEKRCQAHPLKYTTHFCFFEAMNIIKSKWLHQKKIDDSRYHSACFSLVAWFEAIQRQGWVEDSLSSPKLFAECREIVTSAGLDYSDALQIASVKIGYFSGLVGPSAPILATTDRALANAAIQRGVRAWVVDQEESASC